MATHDAAAEVVGRCDDRLGGAQGDGMEKANKCDHFTIRGYVADVRKQDAKACWPLSIPHGQTIEVLVNSLPPLIVPDFRRWCCRNCRHSIITSGDAKGSAPVMTKNEGARVKDFTLVLKDGADNLLSNIEQLSRVRSSGVEVAEVGTSSINVNVECSEFRPMLCHGSKELQNLTKEFIESHISKFIHCGSEEIQHQLNNSTVSAAEDKSVEAEEDVREDITVYASNLNTGPHDNSSNNVVCDERSDIDLNRTYECDDIFDGTLPDNRIDIVASSHRDYDRISVEVKTKLLSGNVAKKNVVVLNGSSTLKDATLSISESPSTNQALASSDQTKNKISCSVDLPDYVDDKNYGREAGHSNGEFNYKKARKIRLRSLEDIMRKDASCAPKNICLSKGDAALSKTKNVHIGPCRLNCEAKHSSENQLTRQIGESVTTVKCLVGSQAGDKYDEETSLNHWLMRVSKKSVADKGSSLTKHREDRACNSVGTSGQKGVHHQEKSSSKIPQQAFVKEKENKRPRIQSGNPCPRSQRKKMRTGDELINFVPPKNIQTNRRNGISKKTLHIDRRNIDNSCDVMCDSYNNFKKVLQVGDVSPSKKQPKKEVKKKRRMINKSGEKNLDDIPMDVVEILAKIQHEKHLSDAKFSTDNNYSVPASNDSCIARGCESNSWNTVHRNPDTSNDMGHAIHIRDQDFQFRQEMYDYSKNQKCHIHIDLNQQASDSHLARSDCIGYNSFGAAPPFAYSKEIHSCHYLPWDKIKMQPFGFCYEDRLSLDQGSITTVPDRLPLQANDRVFGVSMRMSSLEQNCMNIDAHNGYLKGKLVTAVKKSEEVRKPSDPYVLNAGWKAEQSTNKVHLPFETCLIEGQNGCQFRTVELSGSCNKDTVSATNLLRFVNQAAFSGASLDRNSVSNYGAYCMSPCSVIHGSEVGMRNKEMLNGPCRAAYYSQGQNSRSIPQLHRPVARIGVFSPSLQDEIMTHTNKYGTTLDSEFRWTDELPHLQVRGEKAEYFCSPAHFECRNMDHTIFMRKNMPTMSAGSSLVQGYSSSRYGMDQAVVADRGKAVQHPRNICTTGYCIVNKNPADFTLPDDDNEYMREVQI